MSERNTRIALAVFGKVYALKLIAPVVEMLCIWCGRHNLNCSKILINHTFVNDGEYRLAYIRINLCLHKQRSDAFSIFED